MEGRDAVSEQATAAVRIDELVASVLRSPDRGPVEGAVDELVGLARGGSRPALSGLLRIVLELRWAERPVRTVLMDPADIDDAVQATLIAIAGKLATFEGRSSLRTWVGSIAQNEALTVVRRKSRRSEPVTDALPEIDPTARRLSSLVAGEQAYAGLLAHLSPEHRAVISLREEHGLSYDEIAARLAVPVGTVRSRINRARRLLAERLLSVAEDPGS